MNLRRNHYFEVVHTIALRYFLRKKLPYGHIGKNSHVHTPSLYSHGLENIYIGDNCNIDWDNVIYCDNAKFIMKDNSGAAIGLTVVTGNHRQRIGRAKDTGNDNLEGDDVIVEEDVWLASHVTLLAGAHIGRGAIIGAGSVVRKCKVPPYAIVMGNPAKVVGFKWTVEEIIEHEKKAYKEKDRIDPNLLSRNYEKYFLNKITEIKQFTRL